MAREVTRVAGFPASTGAGVVVEANRRVVDVEAELARSTNEPPLYSARTPNSRRLRFLQRSPIAPSVLRTRALVAA